MEQIILGTAGHIDHGKTSLIKALTGTDTDRLKEEKRRGITIELGFAFLDLPGGKHIGIVDVPGHEKFVKNMVAGATGIDMVAMVIAADEGVMPQTKEHMEICSLLGLKHGLVVLTKTDLVDDEWLELVAEDINGFTRGTFLEGSPIIPVSSTTGRGIPEFIKALETLCENIPERLQSGLFRLPVDRVFTMKGFGTVITGTLISGSVHVGDTIMSYPSGITSKVRGIQVHNQNVDKAEAGVRTAINFQGLEKTSVNRGDVLAMPGALKPSHMLDVSLNFLKSNEKPVKNRTRLRFHTGTNEIMGLLILLDRDELMPGETAEAQIRLNEPVACIKDDRFVVRSYSPVRTIGGGRILNPIPGKHKRYKDDITQGIKALVENNPDDVISYHIDQSVYKGVSFDDLKIMTNMSEKQLDTALSGLLSKKRIVLADRENRVFIHHNALEKLENRISSMLSDYHRDNPLKEGMQKEELKSKFPPAMGLKAFNYAIMRMIKSNTIVLKENMVKLSTHQVELGTGQNAAMDTILDAYKKAGLTPPYFRELVKTVDVDPSSAKDVVTLLINSGDIVKIKDDFYIYGEAFLDIRNKLIAFLETHGEITTPQFKDMTGASRKYVIPLLEYFDSEHVTIRIGDVRKLRK